MHTKAMSTGASLASCCDVPGVGDAQAVLPHVLDMLGPWIDERHVLARLHHMGAGIPADGTCANNSYLPTHAFLPAFSVGRG
jgi:hypothetical protein